MQNFKIGKLNIGQNNPCLVVAEISANHAGGIDNVFRLIKIAKEIGADAVKIQSYSADSLSINCNKNDFLINKKSPWKKFKTAWNLYKVAATPLEWHRKIFSYAKKLDIEIFSSPFDLESVTFLEKLKCVAYKIASPEINHIPMLESIGRTKKPVIISTGLSTIKDINLAISTLNKQGSKKIILLKCNSTYPAPINESYLETINNLRKRFRLNIGLSDHTKGNISAIIAISKGAKLIEKHIKLDGIKSPDSFFSSSKKEFQKMIYNIKLTEKAIGNINDFSLINQNNNQHKLRSIYISKDIKKNDKITKSNIKIVRPGNGLHPKYYNRVLNKKVKCDLEKGDRLSLDVIKNK